MKPQNSAAKPAFDERAHASTNFLRATGLLTNPVGNFASPFLLRNGFLGGCYRVKKPIIARGHHVSGTPVTASLHFSPVFPYVSPGAIAQKERCSEVTCLNPKRSKDMTGDVNEQKKDSPRWPLGSF